MTGHLSADAPEFLSFLLWLCAPERRMESPRGLFSSQQGGELCVYYAERYQGTDY